MSRRRLVSAHLSAKDVDLLQWVEELSSAGMLADAVRAGLRIVRGLSVHPVGREFLGRGILAEAFFAGLLAATGPVVPDPGPSPVISGATETQSAPPDAGEANKLAETLDRTLGGL